MSHRSRRSPPFARRSPEDDGEDAAFLPDGWNDLRRTAFLLVAPFGVLACAAGLWIQRPDINPVDLSLLSLIGAALLACAVLVWRRLMEVRHAVGLLYVLASAYFVTMLADQYYHNVGRDQQLSEATFWMPVLSILAFLAWPMPRAAHAAFTTFGASVLVTVAFVPFFEARGFMTPRLTGILLQFFLANGVMVALLSSLAYVQRRLLQLRTMAYVDFLTSLPNRRYLDEKLRRFDAGGADGGSVVMFDVDHFKSVNDTYGHHVGDHVLREIALVAAGHLRDGQLLGRWGGEEFVLLLPDQDEETAARIVERVRRALDTHTFAEVGHVTASFGVAERQPGESVTSTVDRADAAMYAAKRAGRNRVVTASTLAQEASALAESPDLDVETHAVSTASGSPR